MPKAAAASDLMELKEMKTDFRLTVAVCLALLLTACTAALPYRTNLPAQPLDCTQIAPGIVPVPCQASIREHTDNYDLFFVEFDDQGLQYPEELTGVDEASRQIDDVMAQLRALSATHKGISLFVFVHGWKHNAAPSDENVSGFREVLNSAAMVEQASQTPHRVVGIYVGWRGLSATIEPFLELSFWDRKFTAHHVAEGSARALFSRLRGFQCSQNDPLKKERCRATRMRERPKVRIIMIGHSFGGLILYNAISESLIESLTYHAESGDETAPAERFGDMVVLLNPAFEATRYTPLHRIATHRKYAKYQAPIFVSITSTADWATRYAFPAGRFFNTIFETTASREENAANNNTIGHVPLYITHRLSLAKEEPAACAGWKDLRNVKPEERLQQMKDNLRAERINSDAFFEGKVTLPDHWVRPFCGGAVLTHTRYGANSPIWNVETDKAMIASHDDISGPVLTNFLRQLYRDSITYPVPLQ